MTTITNQYGTRKMTMISDLYNLLKAARLDYEADATGMMDGDLPFNSEFEDYLPEMAKLIAANAGSTLSVEQQIERFKVHFDL